MASSWVYNWVQILAHNKSIFLWVWTGLSLLVLWGLLELNTSVGFEFWGLLGLALVLMSLSFAKFFDSIKAASFQFVLSVYTILMTLGGAGWLGIEIDDSSLLGLVVLLTVMTSNLVHVLSSLLREMARGLFQFDAMAEALRFNQTPVFLSNFTTLLGFAFAAHFDSSLVDMAWLVGLGVAVSYLVVLSWVPLVMLSWLLEFRVGNSADRHGYTFVVTWMEKSPRMTWGIVISVLLVMTVLLVLQGEKLVLLTSLLPMMAFIALLLWVFWRSLALAALNTLANVVALVFTAVLLVTFLSDWPLSVLLLMVPLGLIVDDGIHFFSRYLRAKQGVFTDSHSAVRFAMASVGRPIWMTSWIVLLGLLVLLLSPQAVVQQASLMTMVSLLFATLLILFVIPAYLIRQAR